MKNYRPTRPQHRARAHEDAHGEEEQFDPGQSAANPLVFRGEPDLVDTQPGLLDLVARLRDSGSFAYDSEFIGELTYLPRLCLIQTATTAFISLIDPMAPGIDLTPFWELVADPAVEKIVHAGQQDLEPVIRHINRPGQNVFDTQITAGFVGMSYPTSLSKLVREIVGARLGKGLTFTHWDQRPLSAQQLKYAANDVRYLAAVRAELGRRLDSLGHAAWAAEECQAQTDVGLYRFDPETAYMRVRGSVGLPPQNLAVLRELAIWRDAAARQHDVPPRAFLKDEILLDLSRNPIKSAEKLDRVRGLPRPVELAHGAEIVNATRKGLASPVEDQPESRNIEESPTDKYRSDSLWALTQCLCVGHSVDPDLVTSRQEVGRLYRALRDAPPSPSSEPSDPAVPSDPSALSALRLMRGWRHQAVGQSLTAMIQHGGKVELQWNENGLIAGNVTRQ